MCGNHKNEVLLSYCRFKVTDAIIPHFLLFDSCEMRLTLPFEKCSVLSPEQLTVALTRAITAIICCVILLIVLAVLMVLAKWYFQRVCGTTVKRKGEQQEIKVAVFHGRKVPVISMNDFFAPAVWVCVCAFITFWDIFLVEDSFGCDPRLDCFPRQDNNSELLSYSKREIT